MGVVAASGNLLITFDTATPETIASARPVGGLRAGEQIVALAVRPAPGEPALYGLGVLRDGSETARLYRIDAGTGTATQVGSGALAVPTAGPSTAYGIAFVPGGDELRVVNGAGESLRIDAGDGTLSGNDPNLQPGTPNVSAIAYAPALRGLGQGAGALVAIDPADGEVAALGSLGILSASAEALNLDVAADGAAYATAQPSGGAATLYEIDLATGALRARGPTAALLRAFAVLPETAVRFAASVPRVAEGETATITVLRSGSASDAARVAYATTAGTASGEDAALPAGTLTFAPGQRSASFAVATREDALDEDEETIALALRDPAAPLALGEPATATLTIADDELAAPRPELRLGRLPRAVRLGTLLRRGVRVSATPNVPVQLTFALLGHTRRAQLSASENLALVTRTLRRLSAAPRTVKLRPRRALVGRPRHALRLRVQVVATDALGRSRVVNRIVRVRVRGSSGTRASS